MNKFSGPSDRRRPRDDGEEVDDYTFDRQRDRKERRRNERRVKKQMRIEAHQRWVEQRRLLKEQKQRGGAKEAKGGSGVARRGVPTASSRRSGGREDNTKKAACRLEGKGKSLSFTLPAGAGAVQAVEECSTEPPRVKEEVPPSKTKEANEKYVPPALRQNSAVQKPSSAVDEAARRIINKLTVQNVAEMTRETSELFGSGVEGATRASVVRSLSENMNRICLLDSGPLTPIVSLPFAGLIRGLQLLHGNIVGAEMIESLCFALHKQLMASSETAASNGAMFLAHLYLLNAVDSLLASSFLRSVLQMGSAGSVCAAAAGLTFLRACGEKLLKEASAEMERALSECKPRVGSLQNSSSRYTALLSFIKDIVAGRTRSARRSVTEEKVPLDSIFGDIGALLAGGSKTSSTSSNKRSLQRIMSTASVLTGVRWGRLIREDKPNRWYVPGTWSESDSDEEKGGKGKRCGDNQREHSGRASSEDYSSDESFEGDAEGTDRAKQIKMLREQEKALSGQRLNTENKREIFKCIVNASDDVEAFALLMHRDPSFSRLHDTFSVLLQCSFQEKLYNPYYTQVIQRFCSAKTSCKNTLQFAIWDMFKAIRVEAVDVTGYLNLSCLIAQLMQEGVYTLAVLRGLDLENTNRTIGLFVRILLLRLILQLPPSSLTEIFFGGNGVYAHDVKIDTSTLRENLKKVVERYFVKEEDAGKWIPHFFDVTAAGTSFDMRGRGGACGAQGNDVEEMDEEARLQSFVRRIHVVYKALKSGIS